MSIRWYQYLRWKEGRNPDKCLFKGNVKITHKEFIVCQQLEYRHYTVFDNYVKFGQYCRRKVKPSHRCFYEVIPGCGYQKLYFDLDNIPRECDINALMREFRDCIQLVEPLIESGDIIIFSSHDDEKFSFHVVVDHWCVQNHLENRAFFERFMAIFNPNLGQYLDQSMYKSIQQFRIVDSHKFGSYRIKIIDGMSEWECVPETPDHHFMLLLGGGAITNTSYCKILPKYGVVITRPKFISNEIDVGLIPRIERLVPPEFKLIQVHEGVVVLKRLRPSFCAACLRVHNNENPFLTIIHDTVYMHCRRSHSKTLLGVLPNIDENIEDTPGMSPAEAVLAPLSQNQNSQDHDTHPIVQSYIDPDNQRDYAATFKYLPVPSKRRPTDKTARAINVMGGVTATHNTSKTSLPPLSKLKRTDMAIALAQGLQFEGTWKPGTLKPHITPELPDPVYHKHIRSNHRVNHRVNRQ